MHFSFFNKKLVTFIAKLYNLKVMIKPKILLSRCFNEPVRYNGSSVLDKVVEKLKPFIDPVYVCPEVEIGLGIPRSKIILIKEKNRKKFFQVETGKDLTVKFLEFINQLKPILEKVEGAILKSRSPSCGVGSTKLYYNGVIIGKTDGLLAESIKLNFPELPLEDEERLKNPEIYHHFLVRIFSLAEWKNFLKNASPSKLVSFHNSYKFLLKTYNKELFKKLEHLVVKKDLDLKEKLLLYESLFKKAISKKPSKIQHLNTLYYLANYFTRKLNSKEKRYILNLLKKFKRNQIRLETLLSVFKNLAFRFEDNYLLSQKYLQPFPEVLY